MSTFEIIVNTLILFLAIPLMVIVIHNMDFYQKILQTKFFGRKPFDCILCSTFWTACGFIYCLELGDLKYYTFAFSVAVIAELLNQKLTS